MTIFCKVCGLKITSTRLPAAEQQKDVLVLMTNHIGKHQEQAVTLAKDLVSVTQLLGTYLLLKDYVRIPPEETALQESYEANQDFLADLLGFEVMDTAEETTP